MLMPGYDDQNKSVFSCLESDVEQWVKNEIIPWLGQQQILALMPNKLMDFFFFLSINGHQLYIYFIPFHVSYHTKA